MPIRSGHTICQLCGQKDTITVSYPFWLKDVHGRVYKPGSRFHGRHPVIIGPTTRAVLAIPSNVLHISMNEQLVLLENASDEQLAALRNLKGEFNR